ncbi:MAG: hypothetical protein WC547_10915, partial [Candidatus Omnitrophota bacterium]
MHDNIYRLPRLFLERLQQLYPFHHQQILETFLSRKSTTFRINYLKTDIHSLRRTLIEQHVRSQELPFPQGAFISKLGLKDLQTTEPYLSGSIYVQNVSSMIPVLLLAPKNGEKILDLCAAPGAKTTQIVSLAPQA